MANRFLEQIWHETDELLRKAKRIIFCGYSFPDADIHIKYLLKRAELYKRRGFEVYVINGHDSKSEEEAVNESRRFKRFFKNKKAILLELIGEEVEVRVDVEHLEVWYGQRLVDRLPRLRGQYLHRIDYRHVIDGLVRKPGAFAQYRYQSDLFPTSRFRQAYDTLRSQSPESADREYLKLLLLAAKESEQGVDDALRTLLTHEEPIGVTAVRHLLLQDVPLLPATAVTVAPVDLGVYDALLETVEAA
jgi:hypothetical protein